MATTEAITGIAQSDMIIRHALLEGIADMRRQPWLLDFVFASLSQDTLTQAAYGAREVEQARRWFLKTEIPVFLAGPPVKPVFPSVSIALQASDEVENVIGDVHYDVQVDIDSGWRDLCTGFAPSAYDEVTGVMTVPEAVAAEVLVFPGMLILDRTGTAHEILGTGVNTITISPGAVDFGPQTTVRGQRPAQTVTLETCATRESYLVGCHAQGEFQHVLNLHSIIRFILFRYRQALLEARGFERCQVTASDPRRNADFGTEFVYSRQILVSGFTRQVWPKLRSDKITGVVTVAAPGEVVLSPEDLWLADSDGLGRPWRQR